MPASSFVAFHDLSADKVTPDVSLTFAIVLGRAPAGVVLVFNRHRQVWELPGGLIDPGESPLDAARRELAEEANCHAESLRWLGVVEVDDGRRRHGAVFSCIVAAVPAAVSNFEIDGIAVWTPDDAPQPLGAADRALLERFGYTGPPNSA
jgi:8-oxo-dGTP diphosphatase